MDQRIIARRLRQLAGTQRFVIDREPVIEKRKTMMWEDRYVNADGYLFGEAPAQMLVEKPWIIDGAVTCLCAADGEGRNSVWLAKQGLSVTSFDLSPTAVERARRLAAKAGVGIEANVNDWEGWDWSRSFDLVVAVFVQFMGPTARIRQFETLRQA
ncbi:MAG: SAM-dependent methyltransferase, partial [Rhizobiaceae bacterium]